MTSWGPVDRQRGHPSQGYLTPGDGQQRAREHAFGGQTNQSLVHTAHPAHTLRPRRRGHSLPPQITPGPVTTARGHLPAQSQLEAWSHPTPSLLSSLPCPPCLSCENQQKAVAHTSPLLLPLPQPGFPCVPRLLFLRVCVSIKTSSKDSHFCSCVPYHSWLRQIPGTFSNSGKRKGLFTVYGVGI